MAYIKLPLKNTLRITRLITVLSFDFAPNYSTVGEAHDFWEIVYVDGGELNLVGAGVSHHMRQGEMIFHKPNEFHRVQGDGVHRSSVFIITFECRSPAMQFFNEKTVKIPKKMMGQMKQLMRECTQNFRISYVPLEQLPDAPIGGLQLVQNYLECLLIGLMRCESHKDSDKTYLFTSQEHLEDSLAEDMMRYMQERLCQGIRLEDMSRDFHFGISTLCSVFKKNTGKTILGYYLELKIGEAKRMLHENDRSISEISEYLGFDTPQYFSRMFKRFVGVSPREFRNSLSHLSDPYRIKR